MDRLLKLEEITEFILGVVLFILLDYAWWVFPALLLVPDVSMIGYLFNSRTGAYCYNFFHHKGTAILCYAAGFWFGEPLMHLAGVILFSHIAFDRIFGYGFKHSDSFRNTHLGWIGKRRSV